MFSTSEISEVNKAKFVSGFNILYLLYKIY